MQKLQGKIITGLQHCEDQDVIYRAYVMRDVNDEEIEILDQEHLQEWLRNGGNLEMFTIEREEVIANFGQMGRLIRTEGALVSVSSVRSTAP